MRFTAVAASAALSLSLIAGTAPAAQAQTCEDIARTAEKGIALTASIRSLAEAQRVEFTRLAKKMTKLRSVTQGLLDQTGSTVASNSAFHAWMAAIDLQPRDRGLADSLHSVRISLKRVRDEARQGRC